MRLVIAMAAFAAVGVGVAVIVAALRGALPALQLDRSVPDMGAMSWGLIGGGVAGGVVLWLVSGWVVMVPAAVALVWWQSRRMAEAKAQRREMERTAAIASWVEDVRDSAYGTEISQALSAASAAPPPAIAVELGAFSDRLDHQRVVVALDRLRDDLASPFADDVIASLKVISEVGSDRSRELLGRQAEVIRDQADLHERVNTERSRLRTRSTIVMVLMAVMWLIMCTGGRDLLAGYDSLLPGQLLLGGVLSIAGAGLVMLDRLDHLEMPDRFVARREVAA